ncbi:hypothetical protein A2230_09470 [candidate division WOR-1 bacterium RIFOXYA2_FULL_36_21]|uniref:Uncharacterized protein n=1 Tax=candidate division WOR-1 bacterium RIFOXYB2_FULL_36_35 TaxID=1802578 RepID=A0A1F4S3S6_UNCSA|nr:MAG: hypothetical protein A2230_09470 [candidate division WOR-1 bacterium RIFOXYA2_FULL_36_21]OGC15084.1 MAG: hypothetical protein A2290_09290 [candidate division WOR-1 bacterium RIFOXYB2_FULL_36_35]OGC16465.1 MAG: hypothetical protein A2282_03395 [candidate division WOR-1 bacterium RIFOXYA12_FULL_36_13]
MSRKIDWKIAKHIQARYAHLPTYKERELIHRKFMLKSVIPRVKPKAAASLVFLLFSIAKKNGTRATQAIIEKFDFGKALASNSPEVIA